MSDLKGRMKKKFGARQILNSSGNPLFLFPPLTQCLCISVVPFHTVFLSLSLFLSLFLISLSLFFLIVCLSVVPFFSFLSLSFCHLSSLSAALLCLSGSIFSLTLSLSVCLNLFHSLFLFVFSFLPSLSNILPLSLYLYLCC